MVVSEDDQEISARTLADMDEAMRQLDNNNVGNEFDLSEVAELVHED